MRKTIQGLLGIPLLLAAGTGAAAGFDCGKASTLAEKAICASPKVSALDGKLGDVFRAALKNHPEKADALKLDQLHWLADRDAAIADALRDNPGKPLPAGIGQYQARIDFLQGLGNRLPKPLDVVQDALSRLPAGSYDPLADLAKAGVPVTVATDVPIEGAKAFPYEPDDAMRKALGQLDISSGYRKIPGTSVSSLYSVGGTMHCWTETPFHVEGKKAVAIATPTVWNGGCMTTPGMAKVGGDILATVLANPSTDDMSLDVSRWDGKRFGPGSRLALRFDHTLSLLGSVCGPKQSPCDDFATAAMASALRYDRSPVPGSLDRPLKGDARRAYDAMVAAARAPKGIAPKGDASAYPELPAFGTDVGAAQMTGYGPEASLFPIDFRGETLLGFIGHGHVGWRINDDWLVSAWRLKDGKLEPVASAYVKVNRGALLLSAAMASPPPASP